MMNVRQKNGFTLLELVLLILLTVLSAAVAYRVADVVIEGKHVQMLSSGMTRDASEVFFRFSREIRMIRGLNDLLVADGTEVRFIDTNGTNIRYRLNGTDLMRNNQVALNQVASLALSYYDGTGASLVNPAVSPAATDVRSVRIILTTQHEGLDFNLRTEAKLRNAD